MNGHEHRKVIQLAAIPPAEDGTGLQTLYALCDDGTIWLRESYGPPRNHRWVGVPDVPQPVDDEP